MGAQPAAGGGRRVTVEPERLDGWLARFAERHGAVTWAATPEAVVVVAADGAVAECHVPFPPLHPAPDLAYAGLLAHALAPRRVGVLLVRRGGYAAGVFDGPALIASKVGSRQVQGRSAAGGWSQQRFARRRDDQARAAFAAAAETAYAVLVPHAGRLDAVVTGGDRRSAETVLADPRLAPLRALVTGPHLDVPDPRLRVLESTPAQFRSVTVVVRDPVSSSPDSTI